MEWIDTCDIHHWRVSKSIARKLVRVRFEPTTTEFCSDALTDWGIRPWVQVTIKANILQLHHFYLFVQCSRFISVFAFVSRHICFYVNSLTCYFVSTEWIDTYGIHHWGFLEVVIESWIRGIWTHDHWVPFRCSNRLSYQAVSSTWSQNQLCTISSLSSVFTSHFGLCLHQSPHLL